MKKYDKTDDFFREALKDHQITPSDAAKKTFLRDAMLIPPPAKRGGKGMILLLALLVLVSTGIILWVINSDRSSPITDKGVKSLEENHFVTTHNTSHAKPVHPDPVQINQQGTSSKQSEKNNHPGKTPTRQITQSKGYIASGKTSEPSKSSFVVPVSYHQNNGTTAPAGQSPSPSVEVKPENTPAIAPGKAVALAQDPVLVNPDMPEAGPDLKTKKPDSVAVPVPATREKVSIASVQASPWIPSIGVYYTPEWMFNTLEGTKFINNFGIEGTFHFDRFSVRTGAGLSVGQGTNELVVEYNDFLGAYNQLDSMTFTWNDPAHNYVPTMYTSKKDVWDSLLKLDYAKVIRRYTYLQIPFIMGYDFWQNDRISIGARFGPVMSILLSSKQLSAAYDPGNKKVVSINDIAPGQVNLNWQAMAGLSAAFNLTRTLQIEVEPAVRYYFNSVYEKPANSTKPWSVGVRAAFVMKF